MICRGKQIELESFELSSRGGLISKCLYLNDLLNEACMNESYFETDPVFFPNGKAHLLFGSAKGKTADQRIVSLISNFLKTVFA